MTMETLYVAIGIDEGGYTTDYNKEALKKSLDETLRFPTEDILRDLDSDKHVLLRTSHGRILLFRVHSYKEGVYTP